MAHYEFSADVLDDILFRAGELVDGSSDFEAAALRYLNRAYQAIWNGGTELSPDINEVWWWLRASTPGVLTLLPKADNGTVAVTHRSTALLFSEIPETTVDDNAVGWFFKVDDHADVFRITSHVTAAVTASLDSTYTGPGNTAVSYKLFKLVYPLATDVLHLLSPIRAYRSGHHRVYGMSQKQMDEEWPIASASGGVPRNFAPTGEREVRFSHYGGTDEDDLIRLDYEYLRKPSDLTNSASEEPLVPFSYRYILADAALGLLFEDKNDNRAEGVTARAVAGLRAMAVENRNRWAQMAENYGAVRPRQAELPSHDEVLRTESGFIIG